MTRVWGGNSLFEPKILWQAFNWWSHLSSEWAFLFYSDSWMVWKWRPQTGQGWRGSTWWHFQHRLLSLPLELLYRRSSLQSRFFDPSHPTLHRKPWFAVMVGPLAEMLFMMPNSPGNCHVTLLVCPGLFRTGSRDCRGGTGRKGSEFKRRGFVSVLWFKIVKKKE